MAFNQSNHLQDYMLEHAEEEDISQALLQKIPSSRLISRVWRQTENKSRSTPSFLLWISHAWGGWKAVIFQQCSLFCFKITSSRAQQVHLFQLGNKQCSYLNPLQDKRKEYIQLSVILREENKSTSVLSDGAEVNGTPLIPQQLNHPMTLILYQFYRATFNGGLSEWS